VDYEARRNLIWKNKADELPAQLREADLGTKEFCQGRLIPQSNNPISCLFVVKK